MNNEDDKTVVLIKKIFGFFSYSLARALDRIYVYQLNDNKSFEAWLEKLEPIVLPIKNSIDKNSELNIFENIFESISGLTLINPPKKYFTKHKNLALTLEDLLISFKETFRHNTMLNLELHSNVISDTNRLLKSLDPYTNYLVGKDEQLIGRHPNNPLYTTILKSLNAIIDPILKTDNVFISDSSPQKFISEGDTFKLTTRRLLTTLLNHCGFETTEKTIKSKLDS